MDAGCLPGLVWPAAATGAESPSLTTSESEGVVRRCTYMLFILLDIDTIYHP